MYDQEAIVVDLFFPQASSGRVVLGIRTPALVYVFETAWTAAAYATAQGYRLYRLLKVFLLPPKQSLQTPLCVRILLAYDMPLQLVEASAIRNDQQIDIILGKRSV